MKIITYNINGVRAASRLGIAEWLKGCGADFICLQEVRAAEPVCKELLSGLGYNIVCNSGERAGYSGTAISCKNVPQKVQFGINNADIEGRTITLFYQDFILVNSYIPNGGSRLSFKLQFVQELLDYVCELQKQKPVILCADMNTAQTDLDLTHPKQCTSKSGFLPQERELQSKFLECGFVDAYRLLHPDNLCITWRSYRSRNLGGDFGWKFRFDYIYVSKSLQNKISAAEILELEYSDHLPIVVDLSE